MCFFTRFQLCKAWATKETLLKTQYGIHPYLLRLMWRICHCSKDDCFEQEEAKEIPVGSVISFNVEARRPLADPTRSKWKLALKSGNSKRMWWHFPVFFKGQVLQLQVSSCMAGSRGVAESKITLNTLKTLWIMHRFWWSKQLDPSELICLRLNVFVYAKGCDHQVISKKSSPSTSMTHIPKHTLFFIHQRTNTLKVYTKKNVNFHQFGPSKISNCRALLPYPKPGY